MKSLNKPLCKSVLRPVLPGLLFLLITPGLAHAQCLPFHGENMRFSIGWEFIKAGTADMSIEADDAGYRITSRTASNSFLDVFHKVRDTIISAGDCRDDALQSTLFDVVQNEGKYHSSKQVNFLWRENRVTHTQNHQTDSYDVPAGHLNAIDAFFTVRKMQLEPGMQIRIPIFDSRKQYEVIVDVIEREKIFAPWGETIDTLVIIPRLKTEGIFSSQGTVKLWLSDDARHIPLRMTATVKIGRIVADLEQYTPGEP